MKKHKITEGISTTYNKEATTIDAIPSIGASGILDYLVSTPAIFKMIIDASSGLLDPLLEDGFITVGKNIELCHEKPSMINGPIRIEIKVEKVEGDRVYLDFVGYDLIGEICKGKYERVIVNKDKLMENAYKRAGDKFVL